MTKQLWNDTNFCTTYARTWEISCAEVHYGWLSYGENEIELLKNESLKNANVLDVGSGLGQNLVALASQGAKCFGLDISPCMISMANEIISESGFYSDITLEQGDMRAFSAFSEINFDIILSIYSMEYLSNIQELKSVIHNLYKRLSPGGVFIMCFSHPSQVPRYPYIINSSIPQGVGKFRPYNYSIKDATETLFKAGFSIERIVEQQTKNPSMITYTEAKKFPYHFRDGHSPFNEKFDEISNSSPHTIIYKARRQHDALHGIPKQKKFNIGYRKLWGYKRKVVKSTTIRYLGLYFNAVHLSPRDNILGLLDILIFNVTSRDFIGNLEYVELFANGEVIFSVPANSVLGLIHSKINDLGLHIKYKTYYVNNYEDNKKETKVVIESIIGLKEKAVHEFSTEKIGILIFVNGNEPSMGELPLDVAHVRVGDNIQVLYVAYMQNKNSTNKAQLELL